MIVEKIFPTLIAYEDGFLSDSENSIVLNELYNIKEKTDSDTNGWLSAEKTPYNTFRTRSLLDTNTLSFMFERVSSKVNEFSRIHNDMRMHYCSKAWFNIYQSENYQEPHHHYGSTYSAVYFPQAPSGSGKIVFQNPIVDVLHNDNWYYEPRDRMLLIFNSNLRHFVLHGTNQADRISIAMNYSSLNR